MKKRKNNKFRFSVLRLCSVPMVSVIEPSALRLRTVPMASAVEPLVFGTSTSLSTDGERNQTIGSPSTALGTGRFSPNKQLRTRNREHAFTLVELLIAATIFALVSVAVYGTFNSGMKVWHRVREVNLEQRRIMLNLEKLSREFRQTFNFKDIGFLGSKEKIYFAQVLDSELVRITYSYDKSKNRLLRGINTLAQILEEKDGESEAVEPKYYSFMEGIEELSFSYFYFDLQEGSYLWKQEWDLEGLPEAIKLKILTEDGKNYTETIFIPTA